MSVLLAPKLVLSYESIFNWLDFGSNAKQNAEETIGKK